MPSTTTLRLGAAALPALVGSFLLMHLGQAGRTSLLLQAGAVGIGALICGFVARRTQKESRNALRIAAPVLLLLPLLLNTTDGPRRWIGFGGLQLYVVSLVLPGFLVMLARERGSRAFLVATFTAALALLLQPDAPQATAFALACLCLIVTAPMQPFLRWLTALGLLAIAALAWLRPDPLAPVAYVEGVLDLARATGPLALAGALLALALFPIMLFSQKRPAFLAVGIYYVAIGLLAALTQKTPMPLLGFGVGPILGYFFAVGLLSQSKESIVA